MFKNKTSLLLAMLQFCILIQNTNAMDRAMVQYDKDEQSFSDVFVSVPPFGGTIGNLPLVPVQENVWNNIKSNWSYASCDEEKQWYANDSEAAKKSARKMIPCLSLVNKNMYAYFKDDCVLHQLTTEISTNTGMSSRLHQAELRARLERSPEKISQYKVWSSVSWANYPGKDEEISQMLEGTVCVAGQLDDRYYKCSSHEKHNQFIWKVITNKEVVLGNISKTGKCQALLLPLLEYSKVSGASVDENGKSS